MAKLYVVGIGPGGKDDMTVRSLRAIEECQVVVGYRFYIELIGDLIGDKQVIQTGMKGEIERCKLAIEKVRAGVNTCIVSTGDAGLYGMAGPILEMADGIDVEVVPGVTSSFSAASVLGAPIMHDFCTISLSDLLTPWETIEKRLELASDADFVIAIYNPRSKGRPEHLKHAIDIMLGHKPQDTPVGIVKNSGRDGQQSLITTLSKIDCECVDMMSVLIVGNRESYVEGGRIITPRGYSI